MSRPVAPGDHLFAGPDFYVTPRQRLSLGALVLAIVIALICLSAVLYALAHSRNPGSSANGPSSVRSGRSAFGQNSTTEDDNPTRVDTVYLGDPTEAPTAARPAGAAASVHPFVVVPLPRSGSEVGQIPDTSAGRLLYGWLSAFNSTDLGRVAEALPTPKAAGTEAAQLELRKQTGGFSLISAKEVQAGLLVFRLHDQTPSATEFLGTLAVRANSHPATIASFSLRSVPAPATNVHKAATPWTPTIQHLLVPSKANVHRTTPLTR